MADRSHLLRTSIPTALATSAHYLMLVSTFGETFRGIFQAPAPLAWASPAAFGAAAAFLAAGVLSKQVRVAVPVVVVWAAFGILANRFGQLLGEVLANANLLVSAILLVLGFGLPFFSLVLSDSKGLVPNGDSSR